MSVINVFLSPRVFKSCIEMLLFSLSQWMSSLCSGVVGAFVPWTARFAFLLGAVVMVNFMCSGL